MVYTGGLKVEGGSFDLSAERLILREHEIAFSLYGSDDSGKFKVEGVVIKNEDGSYIAPKLPLIYTQYSVQDNVCIEIVKVKEKDGKKRKKCKIKGIWIQNGKPWSFKGKLSEFGQMNKARG